MIRNTFDVLYAEGRAVVLWPFVCTPISMVNRTV